MPRVLLTGFEPFGGETVNPSADAVRAAAEAAAAGWGGADLELRAAVLPVELSRALPVLGELLESFRPDLVVGFGQAGGRTGITPERVAVNLDEAPEPDNAGAVLAGQPVVAGGPPAYLSTLPVQACVDALRGVGIPASVSTTAGTYLCNHVFYGLVHAVAAGAPGTGAVAAAGFVHVPYAHHQVLDRPGTASLAQDTIDAGVRVVVETCLAVLAGPAGGHRAAGALSSAR